MVVQVFICVGILVAYLVGLPYRNNTPQHAYIGGSDVAWWRVMLALGLIPAALQVLSFSASLQAKSETPPSWIGDSVYCCGSMIAAVVH